MTTLFVLNPGKISSFCIAMAFGDWGSCRSLELCELLQNSNASSQSFFRSASPSSQLICADIRHRLIVHTIYRRTEASLAPKFTTGGMPCNLLSWREASATNVVDPENGRFQQRLSRVRTRLTCRRNGPAMVHDRAELRVYVQNVLETTQWSSKCKPACSCR